MLIEDNATLIDVRNYLFARHCHLLLTLGRIEELTKLMHIFLHATIMELDILEVPYSSNVLLPFGHTKSTHYLSFSG